jgi:hypothetical protein
MELEDERTERIYDSRLQQIIDAHAEALAGRDVADVDIADLLPAIFDAVPDVTVEGIRLSLLAESERMVRETDALEAEIRRRLEGRAPPVNDNGEAAQ